MTLTGENRRHKRLGYRVPVEYEIYLKPGSQLESGTWNKQKSDVLCGGSLTCDISEGGIRFYFPEFIPVGTVMRVSSEVAFEKRICLEGEVAWVQKLPHGDQYQVGVSLTKSDSNEFAVRELREFMEQWVI